MRKITLNQYRETFNEAPYELYEFAEGAEGIKDCPELSAAAAAFVKAKADFEAMLEKYEIEAG